MNSTETLPILKYEGDVLDALSAKDILVVVGAPGTGKSTVIPRFILSSNLFLRAKGIVGFAQSRRVAASLLHKRLSGDAAIEGTVGLQTSTFQQLSRSNAIKIMTDGILLKELVADPLLAKYSFVILDEVQARRLTTDLLIFLLLRVVLYRAQRGTPLKLLLLAGAIHIREHVEALCGADRVSFLEIEGKQFSVVNHFLSYDPTSYIDESAKMVAKIASTLPGGTILVFLAGKGDINAVHQQLTELNLADLDIVDLHSKSDHSLACQSPLPARRLCILSTNVAETSVTLPNVRFVVDCGKVKKKTFDSCSGCHRFELQWESKVSAQQRRGRAGREQNGHCYYLFSRETYFEKLADHDQPETATQQLDELVFSLKAVGVKTDSSLLRQFQIADSFLLESALFSLERMKLLCPKSHAVTNLGYVVGLLPFSLKSSYVLSNFVKSNARLLPHAIIFCYFYDSSPELIFGPSHCRDQADSEIVPFLRNSLSLARNLKEQVEITLEKCYRILQAAHQPLLDSMQPITPEEERAFVAIVSKALPWNIAHRNDRERYEVCMESTPSCRRLLECKLSSSSCMAGRPESVSFIDIIQFGSDDVPLLIGASALRLRGRAKQ